MWLAIAAQALLVLAGLRHNLVWGASEAWPWLPTVLGLGEAACVVGYVVLGGLAWWRAMQIVSRDPVRPSRLYRLTLPIVAVAIVVPLFATTDPIDYVVRGRILALHGGNPYVHVATDFPHDPFVAFGDAGWKSFPLPYGPIVACLQGVIAAIAHVL